MYIRNPFYAMKPVVVKCINRIMEGHPDLQAARTLDCTYVHHLHALGFLWT